MSSDSGTLWETITSTFNIAKGYLGVYKEAMKMINFASFFGIVGWPLLFIIVPIALFYLIIYVFHFKKLQYMFDPHGLMSRFHGVYH